MNISKNTFGKKILAAILLLALATGQANAFNIKSLFAIFAPKPKKTNFFIQNKLILAMALVGATIGLIIRTYATMQNS